MKIQISEATKNQLEDIGGFVISPRGEVKIKVTQQDNLKFLVDN